MAEETFRELMRKRVLELKSTDQNFYTETYNIVRVLSRLDTSDSEISGTIREELALLYRKPSKKYLMSLAKMENLYMKFKDDPNLKIRARKKMDIYDIKDVLDRSRRDLLFFLALLEEAPKDYSIKGENE